jgi:hypothetical protein
VLRALAIASLLGCGGLPELGDALRTDVAHLMVSLPLVPAGCCFQIYQGDHQWELQNTHAVPIDCGAPLLTEAEIRYELPADGEPIVREVVYP